MTLAIDASPDHVLPYPPSGAPCCGRPVTDREPIPPGWMLLDGSLEGLGITLAVERQAMDPALRGDLDGTRAPWGPSPQIRGLGCCGYGAPRQLGSLRDFSTDLISEVSAGARAWLSESGLPVVLPPTPTDVVVAVWRLAETERTLEVLRQKLRAMRAIGALRPGDVAAYNNAANTYYSAAKGVYQPVINAIRAASPSAAAIIPALTAPPSIDAPDRPLPWVPSLAEFERIRAGDFSGGGSALFREAVAYVRGRLGGTAVRGLRDLGLFGIDDLTIGSLLLIVIGLVAIAATVIALSIPAYALIQVLAAWAAARAATDVAERRKAVYDACVARGESGAACAAQAQSLAPMPEVPPGPGLAIGLGGAGLVVGAGVALAAWYFLGTEGGRARTRSALSYPPGFAPRRPKKRGRSLRW